MGILFGIFQKVRTHLLRTLEKSVSKSFQKSVVLWWHMFSYCHMLKCLLGKAYVEFQNLRL